MAELISARTILAFLSSNNIDLGAFSVSGTLGLRSAKLTFLVPTFSIVQTGKGLAEAPPFSLQDIKNAIPASCLKKDAWRSMSYLIKDVAIVFGLAAGAQALNQW